MDFSAFEITAWSLASKLFTAAVALTFVHFMTWMWDRTDKIKTIDAFNLIEGNAHASAIYYGSRVIAFCLLAGGVFG